MKHEHQHYMKIAIRLSYKGLGLTAPNPSVGCVIVKDGRIIATGVTQKNGRPHAEVVALAEAGDKAQGATAYVTLEPCSHHGNTPPCADALIKAGIRTVVIAVNDVNPQVNGNGIAALRASGIEVIEDVCRDEAYLINQGFFLTHTDKRPLISLKVATSLDGKIATHSGNSQWITGETARHFGHLLRSNHDAIAVGSGTVLADNPNLTCRLPGLEDASPTRIVFDRRLRMSLEHQIMKTASEIPTLIVTRKKDAAILHDAVSAIVTGPSTSLKDILATIIDHGITRMLIEGGGQLAASFLKERLVDHIYWIQAPIIIGGDGLDAVASLNIDQLEQCTNFERKESRPLGKDIMHHFSSTP